MQQRNIIIFIVTLFLTSSAWLFSVSQKSINPDLQAGWWAVYFQNPKGRNLDFIIENHSEKNSFHWEILAENEKLEEGNVEIEKGFRTELQPIRPGNKKITIRVSSGDDSKEIYKN